MGLADFAVVAGPLAAGIYYIVRNITRLNTMMGEITRRLDKIDTRLDRMEVDARNLPCMDHEKRIARLEGRQRQVRK